MSGPVQGGTKTKLLGTGFRYQNTPVHFKWGVLSTEKVSKNEVEDYLYQKNKYENWWPGFEGIKGYIYEAYSFNKVDTQVDEDKMYQLY